MHVEQRRVAMKNILVLIIAITFLLLIPLEILQADSNSEASKISENLTDKMIEGARSADEAFSENELEKYLDYFTDDFIHDNVTRSPANKEQFAKKIATFFKTFPGVRNYQKDLLPYDKYLVFDECTFEIPIPKNNKTIKIFHLDIVEMAGSKLKVKTTFGDGASMKVALGKIEPPVIIPELPTIAVHAPKPNGLVPLEAQEEFLTRWNKHDLTSLSEMLGQDAEILVSPLLDPVDRGMYIGWQELFLKAFPDMSMETQRSYGGDDWAVSEVIIKGRNGGTYIGNASTGKSIELRAGYLTRFGTEGLITSLKIFIDSMSIMKQLGLEPVSIAKTK